jgi:putative glycosyltransferase (TIGR04372 family)
MNIIKEILKYFVDMLLRCNLAIVLLNKFTDQYPSLKPIYLRALCGCAYRLLNQGKFILSSEMADKICQITSESEILHFVAPIYRLQGNQLKSIHVSKKAEELRSLKAKNLKLDKLNLRVFSRSFTPVGHTGVIDIYLKAEILGLIEKKTNVIIGEDKNFANPNLMQYWKKYCSIINDPDTAKALSKLTYPIEELLCLLKFKDGSFISMEEFSKEVQLKWEAAGNLNLLQITDEHKIEGHKTLEKLGIPKGAWFCGLHVREGTEHLRAIRNADIDSYYLAIEEITKQGGWVIRIGDRSMKPFKAPGMNYIDYVFTEHQSDWMDVFIWAEGSFFLGTGSGPGAIPICFGKPTAWSNWGPLGSRQWGKIDLYLPKLYVYKGTGAIVCMEERLSSSCAHHESYRGLEAIGIKVINNSPEEIRDLVVEMISQTRGIPQYTEEQLLKKRKFADACLRHNIYPSNLATSFIDRYPDFFNNL